MKLCFSFLFMSMAWWHKRLWLLLTAVLLMWTVQGYGVLKSEPAHHWYNSDLSFINEPQKAIHLPDRAMTDSIASAASTESRDVHPQQTWEPNEAVRSHVSSGPKDSSNVQVACESKGYHEPVPQTQIVDGVLASVPHHDHSVPYLHSSPSQQASLHLVNKPSSVTSTSDHAEKGGNHEYLPLQAGHAWQPLGPQSWQSPWRNTGDDLTSNRPTDRDTPQMSSSYPEPLGSHSTITWQPPSQHDHTQIQGSSLVPDTTTSNTQLPARDTPQIGSSSHGVLPSWVGSTWKMLGSQSAHSPMQDADAGLNSNPSGKLSFQISSSCSPLGSQGTSTCLRLNLPDQSHMQGSSVVPGLTTSTSQLPARDPVQQSSSHSEPTGSHSTGIWWPDSPRHPDQSHMQGSSVVPGLTTSTSQLPARDPLQQSSSSHSGLPSWVGSTWKMLSSQSGHSPMHDADTGLGSQPSGKSSLQISSVCGSLHSQGTSACHPSSPKQPSQTHAVPFN